MINDPLQQLYQCHRQIEGFLESFTEISENAGAHLTSEDRGQLVAALRYFAHHVPAHTRNEDESLFPRLRAHADKLRVQAALETLDHLDQEHYLSEQEQASIEVLCHRWLAQGTLVESERRTLAALLASLQERYRGHILVEDTFVFPLAAEVLTAADLEQLGREMDARHAPGVLT